MIPKFHCRSIASLFIIPFMLTLLFVSQSYAESTIILEWLEIKEPNVVGYRVFSRSEDEIYDYDSPIWDGSDTSCLVDILEEDTTYHFVVRVVDEEGYESIDSNEVCYNCPIDPDPGTDDRDTGNKDENDVNIFSESGCFLMGL